MLFNSFGFLVFLPVVFLAYWYLFNRDIRLRNLFLLAASYAFYGWWDWRFLGLIIVSSATDFLIGLKLDTAMGAGKRKRWLALSIALNLGLLGCFKYFNFFLDGFSDLLSSLGMHADVPTLQIMLPVGISFYTFQTLSYSIDIYREQVKPTRDPVAFFAFVAFFPQLVAGPIERARSLLPQFQVLHRFDPVAAKDGLRQMLWGFFKKLVIADNCAPLVDAIFESDPATTPGITLFFGAFFFAFQIYGDFSGYSDIAIGTARLFGIRLSQNFAYPYFARNVSEFWRRWHISLSTWFRDYVYLPLGGWRGKAGRARNILVTFAVSGLWHGANWTFINWGMVHGLYHLPKVYSDASVKKTKPTLRDLPSMSVTFLLITLAWVLFRASSLTEAMDHLTHIASNFLLHPGSLLLHIMRPEMMLIVAMLLVEWRSRTDPHGLSRMPMSLGLRWGIYLLVTLTILLNMDLSTRHEFIYFRF